MLEKRCDPSRIIELVDRGVEGDRPLKTDNEGIPKFSDPVKIGDGEEEEAETRHPPELSPGGSFSEAQLVQQLFPEAKAEEVVREQMAIMNEP